MTITQWSHPGGKGMDALESFTKLQSLLNFGNSICKNPMCAVWYYGLSSFPVGGTQLERGLPKNHHTQRKLLNFKNWLPVENWALF